MSPAKTVTPATLGTIYISGPMSGHEQFNYPAFDEAAHNLAAAGWSVINPANNFGGDHDRPRADYMRLDMQHVLDADAIALLPGWGGSAGACLEAMMGLELGLPFFDARTGSRVFDAEVRIIIAAAVWPLPDLPTLTLAVEHRVTDGVFADSREHRVTDPVTGGQKGAKLAELGAIDPVALEQVANVAGYGSRKYARSNYLRGYAWSLSFDAMMRHLLAAWAGEDRDPESGELHFAHAGWHALALCSFTIHRIGTDDRYKGPP